jgi:hypothetical protein
MNERINILSELLVENGECVFSHNKFAIKAECGSNANFTYDVYQENGYSFDGGEYDGEAKDFIKMILSDY